MHSNATFAFVAVPFIVLFKVSFMPDEVVFPLDSSEGVWPFRMSKCEFKKPTRTKVPIDQDCAERTDVNAADLDKFREKLSYIK